MSDFPTALDAALTEHYGARGIKSSVDSTRGFKARLNALEKAYGTKRAAAAAIGVHKDNYTKWTTKGQKPSAASLRKVDAAYQALNRAKRARRPGTLTAPRKMHVQADVACVGPNTTYYNKGSAAASYRWFRADRPNLNLADMATAWAAGRPPGEVADRALEAVQNAYGYRFEFEGHNVNVRL